MAQRETDLLPCAMHDLIILPAIDLPITGLGRMGREKVARSISFAALIFRVYDARLLKFVRLGR